MASPSFLRNPRWRGAGLGVLCGLVAWLLAAWGPFRGLEEWMLDGLFTWRGPRPSSARVILVEIDADFLDRLKKPAAFLSPELAKVVTHLHGQGASAIGIDLLVPDGLSDVPAIADDDGDGDAVPMGEAVVAAGNVVLPRWRVGGRWLLPLKQWRARADNPALARPTDLGFVDLNEDPDQFVRRQQLLFQADGREAVQFALALLWVARGEEPAWQGGSPLVGGVPVPLDHDGRMRINYLGSPGTVPRLSFARALEAATKGEPLPEVKGAVAIVGITDRGSQDYHATPYSNLYARWLGGPVAGLMAGPEVHAGVYATLADRAFLTTPWWLHPLPWLLGLGAVLGHAFSRMGLRWGFALFLVHHFAWKVLVVAAFVWFSWRVEMVAMLLMGALAYAAVFALRWRTLRRMFGLVKSEAVARAVEADPRHLDLGGQEREVTVLFADIRGFTDYSEKHTAAEVVAMLNAYFAAVVPAVEAEGGTVTTYMGDGVMVLFGAPERQPDHAARAVRAAIAMLREVHARREGWRRLDRAGVWEKHGGVRIGVGVHTGKVVLGAVGSPGRLDYTAIGDVVNTASRIESATKEQGTELLISAATLDAAQPWERDGHAGPDERQVWVKGKQEPLRVYAVGG